ncbi:MAG: hypothetical protein OXP12_00370 [Thaumarchaeota archaeon]|nr:hypothetical protein [Nitrososphaerota archaeon]
MSRKEGDSCPHCETGTLTVDSDREAYENEDGSTGSHRTWLCDTCGKQTRDFYRGGQTEHIGVSDVVDAKKGTQRTVSDSSVHVSDDADT